MNSKISNILLSPTNSICNLDVSSKKALFETIAKHIHKEVNSDSWETVFDALIAREKLGTTGFGDGIAIPHCRLSTCSLATAFFTKLKAPINFDAIDGVPVDLIFVLIVPEHANDEHLNILSKLASTLNSNAFRISLRDCNNDNELFKRITKMISS